MLTKKIVLQLHSFAINKYGGAKGIRDENLLNSAIARPYQSFDGKLLYQSCYEQAGAVVESIIVNHPFIDGNKRTGLLAMNTILHLNNINITATEDELYQFIIDVSSSKIGFDEIVKWLKNNTMNI